MVVDVGVINGSFCTLLMAGGLILRKPTSNKVGNTKTNLLFIYKPAFCKADASDALKPFEV